MAGDWIKMRVGLTTHPRVRAIAESLLNQECFLSWAGMSVMGTDRNAMLRVTRYVTVTSLLRFWGYANEHAKGEFIGGVWPEDIDEVTGVPGFGNAIEAAGWVKFDRKNGGLTMPNFEEHNVSAIERGSSSAERQRRYRERLKAKQEAGKSDVGDACNGDVTGDGREEKRREEKKEPKKQTHVEPTLDGFDPPKVERRKAHRAAEDVQQVFDYWRQVMHHPGARLDTKRANAIGKRLDAGFTVGQLCEAVDGCRSSAYHMGQNASQTVYDDIELICRDGPHTESFINRNKAKGTMDPGLQQQVDILQEWMDKE